MTAHQTAAWGKPGSIALLGAFSVALVLGLAALVVDVGFMYWIRQQEQTVAEAAALAAVKELDLTPVGLVKARSAASLIVSANDPSDNFNFDQDADVIFGAWDGASFAAESEASAINAVRINIIRSAARQNAYNPVIAGAIFGAGGLTISNRATAIAEIGGERTELDCGIASQGALTISGNVDIEADSCSNGNISVNGSSVDVEGDLACGPTATISISGSPELSGSQRCLSEAMNIPSVVLPSNISSSNNNASAVCSTGALSGCLNTTTRDVSLNAQKRLTLTPGTYFFNNISITGQGQIEVQSNHQSQPVIIYVTGTISAGGRSFTYSRSASDADDLKIFVSGAGGASFSGTSNFHGHIYAPQSAVSLSGTANYEGSVTGNTVTMSGSADFESEGTIPVTGVVESGGVTTIALVQ